MAIADATIVVIQIPMPSLYFQLKGGNLIIKFPTKAYKI